MKMGFKGAVAWVMNPFLMSRTYEQTNAQTGKHIKIDILRIKDKDKDNVLHLSEMEHNLCMSWSRRPWHVVIASCVLCS